MSGYNKGNVFYIGEFDGEMEENILVPLITQTQKQADIKDGGRLDLYINSYGGVLEIVQHVLGIVEVAKAAGVQVRTIITGAAYSGGSMVAVAGTPGERYMNRNSFHLVHYGTSANAARNPLESERNHKVDQRFFNMMKKHYRDYAEIPEEVLAENIESDMWHITYTEAKRWNLCDKPLDRLKISG